LNFVDALHCPHYDVEQYRQKDLERMMKKTSKIVAISIENCCAIYIKDKKYKLIKSKESVRAYKLYWRNGIFHKEEILSKKEFSDLHNLLIK